MSGDIRTEEEKAYPRLYTTEEIIAALEDHKGLVFNAAKSLGCHPKTIYARAKREAKIRDCISKKRGEFVDLAEQKLAEAVKNGESWAITLALKALAKDRGYTERSELTGANGAPLGDPVSFYLPKNGRE